MANKMKLIIPLLALLLLSSCNRPSPKVGEIWRHCISNTKVCFDYQIIAIDSGIVTYKDLADGDTIRNISNLISDSFSMVEEVKPIQHYRMMDTGREQK